MFDLLIHDVDYALHVFGMPLSFSASGYEDMANGVDTLNASLNYADGLGVAITAGGTIGSLIHSRWSSR